MRILFYIHCLIGGGAERVTVNLSEELIRRGHSVTIVLSKKIIDYKIDDRVEIDILPQHYEYSGGRLLIQKLCSLYNHFLDYFGIWRTIHKAKPDVIVASWGSKTEPILFFHGKIPVIASEHNTFDREHTPTERRKRFITNRLFDKVVVLTEYDKDFTKSYLNNTVVIPNPLTFNPISLSELESGFSKRKNILACGRVNAYHVKGFDNLIIAFSKVAGLFPAWDLDIAGAGNEQNIQYLKQIASENGVESRVHFLGFCENINEVMKEHGIFVLSSRSEGFGMVITEAMAMGCPCISFALTGPSEIICDGVDGILVENQNIEKMGGTLATLMADSDLRKKLSIVALENVKRFSVEAVTNKWESLFIELRNNE